ncbi:MAG: hypothetical protein MJ177_04640 [Clostridia bacterium]|nr:hypothetical protein [Clostridia bacterium]
MNPTKIIQAILTFTLLVWMVCIGIVIGTKREQIKANAASAQQPYTVVYQTVLYSVPAVTDSTQAPSTLPTEQTSVSEVQASDITVQSSDEQTTAEQATDELTTQDMQNEITDFTQVATLYISAVNKTKGYQDFTLTREDTLNLIIDKATGGSLVKSFANTFVSSKAPHSVETLVFAGGVDQNGSGETPINAIPPVTGAASIDPGALLSANAVANEYGGYNISLALTDEVQTLNTPAQNHATTMEVIDVAALGLPSSISITGPDINYSGATINAVTDSDGKIITMTHHLPVSTARGTGKALGITAEMEMHGDFTCVYTVTY